MINSIKLFNRILELILKNNAKIELVEDLMNKVFFSIFKLIDKVSKIKYYLYLKIGFRNKKWRFRKTNSFGIV